MFQTCTSSNFLLPSVTGDSAFLYFSNSRYREYGLDFTTENINDFSKILAVGWMLVSVYNIDLHNEKHYSFICPLTTVIIIFSKVHSNIRLSHAKFKIETNIFQMCSTFLQCVWVKPHSSSLTNVRNPTSIFSRPVHIFCREKKRLN